MEKRRSKPSITTLAITPLKDIVPMSSTPKGGPEGQDIDEYLAEHRFNAKKEPAENDDIIFIQGIGVGSRGNIISITGREKSRKTVIASAMVSALLGDQEILGITGHLDPGEKILKIDTEQSYKHFYNSEMRSFKDAGVDPDRNQDIYFSYYTRDADTLFQIGILEHLLPLLKPAVIILDGITDYIDDINDQKEAKLLVSKLIQWAEKNNCLFIIVIHTTKANGFMTGAIGTMISKKCQTSIKLEKPDDQQEVSHVTSQAQRDKNFDSYTIRFNNEKDSYEVVDEQEIKSKGKAGNRFPEKYSDDVHNQILTHMFASAKGGTIDNTDIRKKIRSSAKSVTGDDINRNYQSHWQVYYHDTKGWIYSNPITGHWHRAEVTQKKDNSNFADDLPF